MLSLNQRLIDETEIGLAILKSNLNENCNPNRNKNHKNLKLIPQTCSDSCVTDNNFRFVSNDNNTHIMEEEYSQNLINQKNSQYSQSANQFKSKIDNFFITDIQTPVSNSNKNLVMIPETQSTFFNNSTSSKNKNILMVTDTQPSSISSIESSNNNYLLVTDTQEIDSIFNSVETTNVKNYASEIIETSASTYINMNEENATTQITKKKIDETKNSSKNLKESTNKPNKLDSSNAKSMKETSFQKSK